jgi:hypothetical protein
MTTVSRPTTVEMTLAAELIESSWREPGPLSITFAYTTADPLAVFLEFVDVETGTQTSWNFGRDLLREALERTMSGYGDVKFVNHGPSVLMNFNVPDGYATYVLDRGDLRAFLRATKRACKFGAEDITAQLEDAAARLLAGAL